jgi:hypothetical protein
MSESANRAPAMREASFYPLDDGAPGWGEVALLPWNTDIFAHTFRHGRYHADARFPPDLADRRYRFWVRRACTSTEPADRVYVVGRPGNVRGFFQLRLEGDRAVVGIMGVAESAKGSAAAVDLMTGMQLDLRRSVFAGSRPRSRPVTHA